MSTPPSADPAGRLLSGLDGLVDDAAVFPPGNAALDVALHRHLRHREAWYAGLVGPLLVGAAEANALAHLASGLPDDVAPVRVGVIGRPGVTAPDVLAAAAVVQTHPRLALGGVELGWSAHRPGLGLPDGTPLAVELPGGPDLEAAVEALAEERSRGELPCPIGKFRTGATPSWPWPDEAELARVLVALTSAGLPAKLTGGLHHAVRQTLAGEEHHGLLNVLLAVDAALDGADTADVAEVLRRRGAQDLAADVADLDGDRLAAIRHSFVSYGCCEVLDPIGELVDLGLLTGPPTTTPAHHDQAEEPR